MKKNTDERTQIIGSELLQYIVLSVTLFSFWFILSGIMKAKFLIIGLATSLIAAWVSRPLLLLPSAGRSKEVFVAFDFPYWKYIVYWPWLLWEIVKANIDVVKLVLDPKMPIDPVIFTFRKNMSNPLAHVTLANSITLTPGTITIDIVDGVYYIHAITREAAESLAPKEGEGEMPRRVGELFGELQGVAEGGAQT